MRKSGWAAAAGLGSLVLLTACGSSSSTTAASTQAPTSAPPSSAASSASTSQPATSSPASSPATAPSSASPTTGTHTHTAGPQPSGGDTIAAGTTVMIVQRTALGFVLATASGQVVYTYAHDSKGGTPTCTGSCASVWAPVTGVPMVTPGENIPGTFGLVTRSDGTKQMTYNGYPLYRFKGATAFTTHVIAGVWAVVKLSAADLG